MSSIKTVGFPISTKENEKRRALIPKDLCKIINVKNLFFEEGYGNVLGYSDKQYKDCGVNIVKREDVLKKDIICDPKVGDENYIDQLKEGQIIFGWVHAVQNKDITDKILKTKLTAIAWEEMFNKERHCFWRNNEIAGEAAVLHAYQYYGDFPKNTKVAILGRGNSALGALNILNKLGANVEIYNRQMESSLKKNLSQYDVIVNAILWDINRKDHIICKEDLKRMKKNSMIIDISCDMNGAIETSIPTPINNPVYSVDNVLHYVVDHTPALYFKETTKEISNIVCKYMDHIILGNNNNILNNATIIKNGNIIDEKIIMFQNR